MMPFRRHGDTVTTRFTDGETTLLRDLAGQLIELLGDRGGEAPGEVLFAQLGIGGGSTLPGDPALARLLPDAYRDDDDASAEHRRLTERGLVERKQANAETVISSLGAREVVLDAAAVQSWLRTLTDLRLALAARLQIEDDDDEGLGDETLLTIYDWLGWLQGSLVDAIDDDETDDR